MDDMRFRPRKNTPHHVKAIDDETGKVLGRIVDITSDGMMVLATDMLRPGSRFNVLINLPVMVQNRSEITIEIEIVWCNRDSNPAFFRAGCRFRNLGGEEGYIIEEVMHRFNLVG